MSDDPPNETTPDPDPDPDPNDPRDPPLENEVDEDDPEVAPRLCAKLPGDWNPAPPSANDSDVKIISL